MLERLQKIIARAGIASRRHAEELIRGGQVRVNGVVVTELGAKADPERDRVEAAGRVAERPAEIGYYLLHKPPHVVSTMSDPEGRATLRHLLRGLAGGVFPVGRLDYASSGLMLLTTDGELANRIFRSAPSLPQVYWVKVAGRLTDDELQDIRRRAQVRMRRLRAPGSAGPQPPNPWFEVEFNDARNDHLRETLFAMKHPVEKTKRVKLGPLDLGALPEAQYRSLDAAEIAQLRGAVERAEKAPRKPAGAERRPKRRFRPQPMVKGPAIKGQMPQAPAPHGPTFQKLGPQGPGRPGPTHQRQGPRGPAPSSPAPRGPRPQGPERPSQPFQRAGHRGPAPHGPVSHGPKRQGPPSHAQGPGPRGKGLERPAPRGSKPRGKKWR